jgi:hypothetical protein
MYFMQRTHEIPQDMQLYLKEANTEKGFLLLTLFIV